MTKSVNNIPLPQTPDMTRGKIQDGGKPSSRRGEDPAIGKVAREFESLFIGMMLKSMRATVGKDTLTGGGHGEEVYRSLLDQEYATAMSSGGGLGLRKTIEEQLVPQTGDGKDNDHRTKQ